MPEYYAHTPNDKGNWHSLEAHLKEVAELAKGFADKIGAGELAYWVGLWHDIGKIHPDFQEYLQKCAKNPKTRHRGPDHKGAGAIVAQNNLEPLAFLVAGHHGGLPNNVNLKAVWLPEKAASSFTQQALRLSTDEGFRAYP